MPPSSDPRPRPGLDHTVQIEWQGNLGPGTVGTTRYDRTFRVRAAGKPELLASADPAFRGAPDRYNPEELLLAALAGCHMLFYLSLCARNGVRVVAYEDRAHGTLALDPDGGGRFERLTLTPEVTIAAGSDEDLALRLHETAHGLCFVANSCSVPVELRARVRPEPAGDGPAATAHGVRGPAQA